MDPISWDALKAREQIIKLSDINLDEDYFVIGHQDKRRSAFQWTDYPLYLVKALDVLGPVYTNVDRQLANSNVTFTTLSETYIDVPNMVLTTLELGGATPGSIGNYQIDFSCNYALSDLLSSAQFLLNVNGVDILPTEINEAPNNTGRYRTNLIWQMDNLPAGIIIKIKFKITSDVPGVSTLSVYNRSLRINGVNVLNVI